MKINNNKIDFEKNKILTFDFPVLKTLMRGEVIIVLLKIPAKIIFNENVYGVSTTGDMLWQICTLERENANCPFIDMHITDEGRLILRNWCHLNYEIDSETGKVLNTGGYRW